ncbi:MAG TPA: septum site-determining protein MinC [Castellaniella sp.]|nr:septum site-determining protein MinC [Castellaniella sp.]
MSTAKTIALDFKSATLYALRAVLHDADTDAMIAALDQRMAEAGAFYENEAVVLDATGLQQAPDWAALLAALRGHGLHPIGVLATGEVQAQALAQGLAPVEISGGRSATVRSATPLDATDTTPAPIPAQATTTSASESGSLTAHSAKGPSKAGRQPVDTSAATSPEAIASADDEHPAGTLVIRHPLRSGQRIYARGGDLVVIGMVSQGAEVIADGNIHVYGPLRGKAMAGARGDTGAMILTTQLDPELLAIAGVYRVVEARLSENLHKQPAIVQLDGDSLRIKAL